MSIPGSANPLLLASAAAAGGYEIERSLRFNSADSAYLSRTPASAGNRKTWTWAGWVKRVVIGQAYEYLLDAGVADNFGFAANSAYVYFGSGPLVFKMSSAVFRDPSAWFHYLISFDSTNATAEDRCQIWINGVRLTAWSSNPTIPLNFEGRINSTSTHTMCHALGYTFMSAYLADIHFIDGQALTPSSFTEFDDNGVLQPKAYAGSYGTNGFHLPFSDNSTAAALGTDTSGNGNTWTVNNLTAGPAFTSNSWSGYFDGTGDYLSLSSGFTLGTGNFTVEAWIKTSTASQKAEIWQNGGSLGSFVVSTGFNSANAGTIFGTTTPPGSGWSVLLASTGTLAANTWNHVAWVRSSGVITIYINGAASGTLSSSANSLSLSRIGAWPNPNYDLQGYISNLRVVVGSAVYTSGFTVPTTPLTAITNTSLLTLQSSTFVDNSSNAYSITSTGDTRVSYESPFEEPVDTDSLVDSPTNYGTDSGAGGEVRGNYCTINAILPYTNTTISNGNLDFVSGATYRNVVGTFGVASGKWYWEITVNSWSSDAGIGITNSPNSVLTSYLGSNVNGWAYSPYPIGGNGSKYGNGAAVAYGSTYTNGDIIGVAFDADNGTLAFYKNGTSQGNAFTSLAAGTYFPSFGGGNTTSMVANFGQRPFAYTAPSGFKALCTTNLPEPTIADGSTAMDVALYTGNGSTQTISGLNFSPDLVWLKQRSGTNWHEVYDAIRGAGLRLFTNTTNGDDATTSLTSFNSDGFSLNNTGGGNVSSTTYVAWTWDAGSTTVTNTQGSITSQVRANASAGFSVVTVNSTTIGTIGHGLGVKPAMIIEKCRGTTSNWYVRHQSLGDMKSSYLTLNTTTAAGIPGDTTAWNNTEPTSTTISINNNYLYANGSVVYYCFAPVAGYSSFGSYTGNGLADGPFVYTGFRPKFLMQKKTSGLGEWIIWDSSRKTYNFQGPFLFANTSAAESADVEYIDFLSNGFKCRSSNSTINGSGATSIYIAFAENPFATARAR